MSRIGKLPVPVPPGVEVEIDGPSVRVKGPKGELRRSFDRRMEIALEGNQVSVRRSSDEARHRALHGLTRSLIANMVTGVSEGYRRDLEIRGVGYRAEKKAGSIVLNVGFSHQVVIEPPEGIELGAESPVRISVTGIDKEKVGQTAATIRAVRPPEPYKGKGIFYAGEEVRRKAGKATAAV